MFARPKSDEHSMASLRGLRPRTIHSHIAANNGAHFLPKADKAKRRPPAGATSQAAIIAILAWNDSHRR
jgi:hypothetical protein